VTIIAICAYCIIFRDVQLHCFFPSFIGFLACLHLFVCLCVDDLSISQWALLAVPNIFETKTKIWPEGSKNNLGHCNLQATTLF